MSCLRHPLPVADRLPHDPDHPLVALDHGGGVTVVGRVHAGEQVPERVQHHVGLAEGRQHLADVAQEGGVRADDQHAAALQGAAVGVQEVGGAVQRGDRLAGARAALDDQDARQVGADYPVLLGLDGRDDVGHPAGARRGDRRDERGLAGKRAFVFVGQLVQVEYLVIDAGDDALPRVDVAAANQSDRVTRRRGVERPRGRGPPVDQLQLVIVIAQADPADVKSGLLIVVRAAEAQSALGQVELGNSFLVLGRGNVALQAGLVSAAGAAPGAHVRPAPAHYALSPGQAGRRASSRILAQPARHRRNQWPHQGFPLRFPRSARNPFDELP